MDISKLDKLIKESKDLLRPGDDPEFDYSRIPFGIAVLDKLIGGGIPKKRMTLLAGHPNTGKSFLASQVAVSVQKSKGAVAWFDMEMSWDPAWMERCGLDISEVLVAQPESAESAFDGLRMVMENGIDLVVLDSIAGLVPTNVQEEDFSYSPMAWQARFVNSALPKVLPYLRHGSAFIAINQLRSGLGRVSTDKMPGGVGQEFYAHFILNTRRAGWIKEKIEGVEEMVGFDMEIRCRKSKVGGQPFRSCVIPFRLEGGIDLVETLIREGLKIGLIRQSGAWYQVLDEEKKIIGMDNVRKLFLESEVKFQELSERLEDKNVFNEVEEEVADASQGLYPAGEDGVAVS